MRHVGAAEQIEAPGWTGGAAPAASQQHQFPVGNMKIPEELGNTVKGQKLRCLYQCAGSAGIRNSLI